MPTETSGGSMKRIALLASLALVACEADANMEGGAPVVTDSAGVRVVEYPPLNEWNAQVTLVERLRVGETNGPPETLFSKIAGGKIMEDGSIVLADFASREIRQFSGTGDLLRSHGGKGQGPGEYEYIVGMGRCAPTGFTVFDIGWTVSFYDDSGQFINERPTRLENGRSPYYLACDTSGRMAAIDWALPGDQIGNYSSTARLRLLNAEGVEIADLGERIGADRYRGRTDDRPHPAGRATEFGFLETDLIVADGSFFGFERWDDTGELVEIVRIDVPPPDGDSLMSEYLEWTLSRAQDDDQRRRWRQSVADLGLPAHTGFFSELVVTSDQVLFQEKSVAQRGRWFAFRPDGTPLGFLPLPTGARILDARGDLLLVEEPDLLDVPVAVLYSVINRE